MADGERNALGPKLTSIGQAVVALLRVGLNCLKDHTEKYASPDYLTEDEAIQAGLRLLKGERKRRRRG